MKHIARLLILSFLVVVSTACSSAPVKVSCASLLPDIPRGEVNTDLSVSLPKSINTFKIGDFVGLEADVHSARQIEVVPDKDLKIFWWTRNSWSEIKNQNDYSSVAERLSLPTDDIPGSGVFDVLFYVPPHFTSVQACIVLMGVKDPDGSRVNVGAYIEFMMYP